jgi:hypothetical protein
MHTSFRKGIGLEYKEIAPPEPIYTFYKKIAPRSTSSQMQDSEKGQCSLN